MVIYGVIRNFWGLLSIFTRQTSISVGREGVEPSRCHHRRILSPLRLPIPPPPRYKFYFIAKWLK